MPKLVIDTKGSFYEPIEVEIDGKAYRVRKISRDLLNDIDVLDKDASKGIIGAAYERLSLLLENTDRKALDKLDIRDVQRITDFIITKAFKATPEEKNESRPGPEKLPS